ncbi:uncharacterized protein [Prorops nasuta]|uniref:uncharacterized protein n=1 Tax=Prorops nasuta TaxID=863751 RepID=UPI0034CD4B87
MGKICAIANCCSGRSNDVKRRILQGKRKLAIFSVPKCAALLQIWNQAIAQEKKLNPSDFICELHFQKNDVIKEDVTNLSDGSLYKSQREKCKLRINAIPLPWNKVRDETLSESSMENENDLTCHDHSMSIIVNEEAETVVEIHMESEDDSTSHNATSNINIAVEASTAGCIEKEVGLISHTNDFNISAMEENNSISQSSSIRNFLQNGFTINSLKQYLKTIPLPKTWSWLEHTSVIGGLLLLQSHYVTLELRICIEIYNDLFVMLRTGDQKVKCRLNRVISSPQDFLDILELAEKTQICTGTGFKHNSRHKDCHGFIDSTEPYVLQETQIRCIKCRQQRRTLQISDRRKVLKMQNKYRYSKQRINLLRKKNKRKDNKIRKLRENIAEALKNCGKIKKEVLDGEIAALPEEQQEAVKTCFKNAKAANAKQRRYTLEWVYECLLVRIKSKRCYDHLRKRNILPLPCPSTLNKHLRSIDSSAYGFQPAIFQCLKLKALKMELSEKRGELFSESLLFILYKFEKLLWFYKIMKEYLKSYRDL